jgi:hypothetical protein
MKLHEYVELMKSVSKLIDLRQVGKLQVVVCYNNITVDATTIPISNAMLFDVNSNMIGMWSTNMDDSEFVEVLYRA